MGGARANNDSPIGRYRNPRLMGESRAFDLRHSQWLLIRAHDSTLGGYSVKHDQAHRRRYRTAVRASRPTRRPGSTPRLPRAHAARLLLPGGRHPRMHHPVVLSTGPPPGPRRDRDGRGRDLARPAGQAARVRPEVRPGVPPPLGPGPRDRRRLGTWGEKSRDGRTYHGIIRSSFLVDGDGRIERAWYSVKPEDTVPNALEALRI